MRKLLLVLLLMGQCCWALERQPNADYHARREALAKKTNGNVVVLFAPMEAEGPNAIFGFHQDENFYYLSGWPDPGAALLIAPAVEATADTPARPYTEIFFLPAHNYVEEKWTGPKLGAENPGAAKITGFDQVEVLDKLRDALAELLPKGRKGRLTVYSDITEGSETAASTGPLEWLKRTNAFPGFVALQDIKPMIASLRTYKDAGEVQLIRKATDASVAAHFAAMRGMKPGITEREISALMQYEFGKRGCERPAYAPIVGSGYYSTVLHYSEDSATMKAGDVVVIDVGGEYSMYATDITRTLPVSGKFTARQREIYDIVLGAQQAAMDAFVSGKSTLGRTSEASLDRVAREYINTHGKDLHGKALDGYFIHGLSHYVGLNVHDAGDYSVPIGPGMVFTIEPGIYIPEESLGVRIEDMFYVDKSGKLVKLTAALPSTAEEVEKQVTGK